MCTVLLKEFVDSRFRIGFGDWDFLVDDCGIVDYWKWFRSVADLNVWVRLFLFYCCVLQVLVLLWIFWFVSGCSCVSVGELCVWTVSFLCVWMRKLPPFLVVLQVPFIASGHRLGFVGRCRKNCILDWDETKERWWTCYGLVTACILDWDDNFWITTIWIWTKRKWRLKLIIKSLVEKEK